MHFHAYLRRIGVIVVLFCEHVLVCTLFISVCLVVSVMCFPLSDLNNVTRSAEEAQQDTHVDEESTDDADEIVDEVGSSPRDVKGTKRQLDAEEPMGDVDGIEDVAEDDEEADRGEGTDPTAKQKKCRLVCKECGERFPRREMFNLHRHFHAHGDELTPLTCKECGLTFQHRSSLIKHRNEHKEKEEQLLVPKKEAQTMEVGSFECAECEKIFSTVDKLRDHNCFKTVEKPYHCPLCRQEFQFRASVTKHMMTHSQERKFTCQECSQTFPNVMVLRYHQRCHTALKPYECPECGMVFKHYSVMEDHRRKHTDNTRSHLFSSYLQQHLIIHTGKKPYKCPDCGKDFAFIDETQLQQHMLSHNGDKPHKCDQCDKSFGLAYLLRDHMNTHTGERPHHCNECNKSFSWFSSLLWCGWSMCISSCYS
uniref:C2H2-type domain-containing protein n=1 Tax=Labrus bergylta TaxID=56723 RepID=A0A3Q3GT37_9LABR